MSKTSCEVLVGRCALGDADGHKILFLAAVPIEELKRVDWGQLEAFGLDLVRGPVLPPPLTVRRRPSLSEPSTPQPSSRQTPSNAPQGP